MRVRGLRALRVFQISVLKGGLVTNPPSLLFRLQNFAKADYTAGTGDYTAGNTYKAFNELFPPTAGEATMSRRALALTVTSQVSRYRNKVNFWVGCSSLAVNKCLTDTTRVYSV